MTSLASVLQEEEELCARKVRRTTKARKKICALQGRLGEIIARSYFNDPIINRKKYLHNKKNTFLLLFKLKKYFFIC